MCRDRQASYGDAEDNFRDISALWNTYLGTRLQATKELRADDIAAMCALIKVARLKTSPQHRDNWIDLAGYAVCGAGIVERARISVPQ